MDMILAVGASIIIRPKGWNNEPAIALCVEHHGLRHGLRCHDGLEAGLAEALQWVQEVDFYHGAQWTVEDCKRMEARPA